jgi:hypothetical protein
MNEALRRTMTESRRVPAKASASIHVNSESDSNEIDESDVQFEKHIKPKI